MTSEINIPRKSIKFAAGTMEGVQPFSIGMVLKRAYPHDGSQTGKHHKGDLEVIEILDIYDDAGNVGIRGSARCKLPGCNVKVTVRGVPGN